MSGLLANPSCGCGGPTPCTYHKLGLEWNAVEHLKLWPQDGGTIPTQVQERSLYPWGPVPVIVGNDVHLSGDGYSTIRALDPQPEEMVYVRLIWDTAKCSEGTKIGLSIRRADSPESLSVVYDHDAETLELFHGSTSLHLLSGTFSGPMDVKIELPTPLEPTTDINVYVDEVLEYTESAFAFELPEELSLGIVFEAGASGELRWDEVHISPCPYCSPPEAPKCTDFDTPRYWKVTLPEFGDRNPNSVATCVCEDLTTPGPNLCQEFAGDYYLVNALQTQALNPDIMSDDQLDPRSGTWFPSDGSPTEWNWADKNYPCEWLSVLLRGEWAEQAKAGIPGRFPVHRKAAIANYYRIYPGGSTQWFIVCDRGTDHSFNGAGTWPAALNFFLAPHSTTGPGGPTDSIIAKLWIDSNGHIAPYTGSSFGLEDADCGSSPNHFYEVVLPLNFDFLTQPVVLNHADEVQPTLWPCTDPPATITLVPEGGSDEDEDIMAQFLANCDESCEPPVEIVMNTCYTLEMSFVDEDGGYWRYAVAMSLQWDDLKGSWEWSGFPTGYDNYEHDTCGILPPLHVRVHCARHEEGASKQWIMTLTNTDTDETSTFPMTFIDTGDPDLQMPEFVGTTDIMCLGQTWDFHAFGLFPVLEDSYALGSCTWGACSAPTFARIICNISLFCEGFDVSEYRVASGALTFMVTGNTPPSASLPVDGQVWYANLPTDGEVKGVFMWGEGGAIYAEPVNAQGESIVGLGPQTTNHIVCDPNSGEITEIGLVASPYAWSPLTPPHTDPFGRCHLANDGFGEWTIWK